MNKTKTLIIGLILISLLLVSCNQTPVTSPVEVVKTPSKISENTASVTTSANIVVRNVTQQIDNQNETSPVINTKNAEKIILENTGITYKTGCYDSEGGRFYNRSGYIVDTEGARFDDECLKNQSILKEVYCGLLGYKDYEYVNCVYGCSNGVCNDAKESDICKDTDGGRIYYKNGSISYKGNTASDFCRTDKYLIENFCTTLDISSKEEKYCQYGCKDGACLENNNDPKSTCQDSDLGVNETYIKGSATDPNGVAYDFCMNSYTVKEYKCDFLGYKKTVNIICQNNEKCVDGACIK